MGAILDAAQETYGRRFVVSDPFSGGGTVAFEAVRRGLPVYAQDLYAWPTYCLKSALDTVEPDSLQKAGSALLESLKPLRAMYRRTDGASIWEITHVIRVRKSVCPKCKANNFLFPTPLVSLASRKAAETDAFFGCVACGGMTRRRSNVLAFQCDECHRRCETRERTGQACPTCHCCSNRLNPRRGRFQKSDWHPALLQERRILGKGDARPILRPVCADDPVADIGRVILPKSIKSPIPPGLETNHLLASGFRRWADLYSRRQLIILIAAIERLRNLRIQPALKDKLAIAVLGACELPAFLSRWDRYHPKVFEALANHRYARTTLAVEANPLSPIGRGTIPRRLRALQKATTWLSSIKTLPVLMPAGVRRRTPKDGILICSGSSARQALANNCAQLVLTDPPYHDDVQYGELSRLFHAWLGTYLRFRKADEAAEAVPNRMRARGTAEYESTLVACFSESRRTLTGDGRMILTFHNNDLRAWKALSGALWRSRFVITSLATVIAENRADHSKRNKRAFLSDLVLECKPKPDRLPASLPRRFGTGKNTQAKNLLAMGLAISEKVNRGSSDDLKKSYLNHLNTLGVRQALIH